MEDKTLILPVPIIVLEDDPLIQNRLHEILLSIGYTIHQILFAQNLAQAKKLLETTSASFALVDLGLPDGSGIDFIKILKDYDPTISILVISAWSTEDMLLEALSAGATGYVLKERDDFEIIMAIRSVLRGGAPIDPFMANKILGLLIEEKKEDLKEVKECNEENTILSKREYEILNLVAQGLSNKEIANHLNLSRYTIESHIKHIYRKLEVCTRTKALGAARSLGILH
ncbi:response regulator transcription factor [Acinetobacter sp. MD2(2019)]|uniref:response regulator transcription factor n=1 Tax=Acinetobacter sp. MD2(2019) TaxID=2605273 RepID=UPI002D1EFDC8|nr:response regulator transcription factor [Acinetobacter sp. MD2(2019)]MEB3755136.1 response regulator transcription factor [Acinetobacter sp. MD2(2019)]